MQARMQFLQESRIGGQTLEKGFLRRSRLGGVRVVADAVPGKTLGVG